MAPRLLRLTALILFAHAAFPVFSQETAGIGPERPIYSYTRAEGGKTVFVQHLSWPKAEHARNYEITVERRAGSEWETALRETTGDTFIEFSYPPGEYRYQIQARDYLNRPAGSSGWQYFSILAVPEPEIKGFSPGVLKAGKKGAGVSWLVTVEGAGFVPGVRVFLRNRTTGGQIEAAVVRVSEDMRTLDIRPDPERTPAGLYDILVVSPGGSFAEAGPLAVQPRLTAGFTFQAGYAPLAPLYGGLFDAFPGFAPLGLYARAGVLPLKNGPLDAGLDFSLYWNSLHQNLSEYQAAAQLLEGRLNAAARFALVPERLALNLRLGGGVTGLLDFNYRQGADRGESFNGLYFSAGGDLSLQWFPVKKPSKFAPFFAEAGVGYTHIFTAGGDSPPGLLRFYAGAGMKY